MLDANYASNRAAISPAKPVHAAVKRACDYLHAHYANDISLEELAEIADLSRFHFCRIFSKAVGVSPSVYQTQLRIAQARKLLAQGLPIATVATMTGFYDQSHFGWHFKRQEITQAVMWLASDAASYVSGMQFDIDGGGLG